MVNELVVTKIGSIAAEVLSKGGTGKIGGITSRGVFIRIRDRILFLTSEDFRSPFNLTISRFDPRLNELKPGDQVIIRADELFFPDVMLKVKTGSAELWTPTIPAQMTAAVSDQVLLAEKWIAVLCEKDPNKGFLFLAGNGHTDIDVLLVQQAREAVSGMLESFKRRDLKGFLVAANGIIGSGGGLTPSGDDVLTGFFLYHTRYDQAAGEVRPFIQEWCTEIVQLAYQKTTTISANRLEAAGLGMAEGIFLQMIDALFDPSIQLPADFFDRLINFGHSSGVDTFMGIYFGAKSLC